MLRVRNDQSSPGVRGARSSGWALGVLLALIPTLSWGGQLPVGKALLPSLGALYMTTIRYAFVATGFVLLLALVEGRPSLRYDGRFRRAALLGAVGIAGFNLLTFAGLAHSRPQNVALIGALMPLFAALVLWAWRGIRPSGTTLLLLVVALCGVGLVITRGHLSNIFSSGSASGGVGSGDLLAMAGAFCWIIYTLGASTFLGWSPLRYTALTVLPGALTVLAIAVAAGVFGLSAVPSLHAVADGWWQLLYMIVPGGLVAVLFWNLAVKRLGPQNSILFMNLIPITTLAIQAVRGDAITAIEVAGAALTIGALVLNNLLGRRQVRPAPVERSIPIAMEPVLPSRTA